MTDADALFNTRSANVIPPICGKPLHVKETMVDHGHNAANARRGPVSSGVNQAGQR
jgi:hypothetical protein